MSAGVPQQIYDVLPLIIEIPATPCHCLFPCIPIVDFIHDCPAMRNVIPRNKIIFVIKLPIEGCRRISAVLDNIQYSNFIHRLCFSQFAE